jgi:hypothetical protein
VSDGLRQTLNEYLAALERVTELRRSATLRWKSEFERIELYRREWGAGGPHRLEDTRMHNELLKECSSKMRSLSSTIREASDAMNMRNEELYERAHQICNDPNLGPIAALDYMRDEFVKRVGEFPSYEVFFTGVNDAYEKLEAFMSRLKATQPANAQKRFWRRS